MKINQEVNDGFLALVIDGDLDANSAIAVDKVIKEAFANQQYQILVDCRLLHYISSAGLGVFVSYLEESAKNKGNFIFYHMSNKVYNIFQLLGLHDIFPIVKTKRDAKLLLGHEV